MLKKQTRNFTDFDGKFYLNLQRNYTIKVSLLVQNIERNFFNNKSSTIALKKINVLEEVLVSAVRVNADVLLRILTLLKRKLQNVI